jgi:bacteriocin-like protein
MSNKQDQKTTQSIGDDKENKMPPSPDELSDKELEKVSGGLGQAEWDDLTLIGTITKK